MSPALAGRFSTTAPPGKSLQDGFLTAGPAGEHVAGAFAAPWKQDLTAEGSEPSAKEEAQPYFLHSESVRHPKGTWTEGRTDCREQEPGQGPAEPPTSSTLIRLLQCEGSAFHTAAVGRALGIFGGGKQFIILLAWFLLQCF